MPLEYQERQICLHAYLWLIHDAKSLLQLPGQSLFEQDVAIYTIKKIPFLLKGKDVRRPKKSKIIFLKGWERERERERA